MKTTNTATRVVAKQPMTLDPRVLLTLLRQPAARFHVGRGVSLEAFASEHVYREACSVDPLLLGLLALAPEVQSEQQARVLYVLLGDARVADANARRLLTRITRVMAVLVGAEQLLQIGVALRRRRRNRKLASRTLLWGLLLAPGALYALQRRPRSTRAVVEHALGRSTARGLVAHGGGGVASGLRRLLGAAQGALAAERLLALYRSGGSGCVAMVEAPAGAEQGDPSRELRRELRAILDGIADVPKTVTATNRGAISATLYHLFRGGRARDLERALAEQVGTAAETLPRFAGRLALVIDPSGSMRGYGSREWAIWAQTLATAAVLHRCCGEVTLHGLAAEVDPAALPLPSGGSDLALPLLEALKTRPDAVLVLTDGYENRADGDLERVLAAKERIGDETPVLLGLCTFTSFDEVAQKLPTQRVPWLRLWHQVQLPRLLLELAVAAGGYEGRALSQLRASLLEQLAAVEALVAMT